MNYDDIKELASQHKIPVTELIALAPANDPMYVGKPNDIIMGEWFARLWRQFGYTSNVHLRRVHYQVVSQRPKVQLPVKIKVGVNDRGDPVYSDEYLNTESCWDYLTQAGKVARYLGLVPIEAIIDRRNPDPRIFTRDPGEPELSVYENEYSAPELPGFPDLPSFSLWGYEAQQRYHLEIWAEKSTMNDVLIPLCERFRVNYVTGLGEMSIPSTLNAVERIRRGGRPARILYISDFDPAGMSMPVAVSRKIEYLTRDGVDDPDSDSERLDIRVYPIVLTADQVRQYNLPRTPIKASERRGAAFEQRHGAGAVELDALEALRPGELARIVTRWLRQWWDNGLDTRVYRAEQELREELRGRQAEVYQRHQQEIDELRQDYDEIRELVRARLERFGERQRRVWQAISQELRDEQPDLDDYPVPQADESTADADVWPLFHSERGYMEQLRCYKTHQNKATREIED